MSTRLTDRFPVCKTRSQSKSTPKSVGRSIGLRSRTLLCKNGNSKDEPKCDGERTEVGEGQSIRNSAADHLVSLLKSSPVQQKFPVNSRSLLENQPHRSSTLDSPCKASPRKNLTFQFDKAELCSPDVLRTPRKSDRILNSPLKSSNGLAAELCSSDVLRTPRIPDQILNSPLKRTNGLAASNSLSPTKQRRQIVHETPKKDQENSAPSPVRTPKRQNKEQVRLAVTSPPKRKKDCIQRARTYTPIALFKQNVTSYQAAKEALHCSTPSRLVSRDRQINDIRNFVEEQLTSAEKPGSLYISGAPGTGKTACLMQLLDSLKAKHKFLSIVINCMTVRHPAAVFEEILSSLSGTRKRMSQKETMQEIERIICKRKNKVILVLDEMDQLSTKNQHVLYSIFEWPRLPSSSLALIGIANSLDLTDRILPRLHTCGFRPTLLHFPPYSQQQITEILQDRLKELTESGNCIINPKALFLCARKIAAQSGDVRKALDTCRRAVEMIENSVRCQQVLRSTSDDRMNPGSPRRSPRKLSTQTVEPGHIIKVLHEIYGSRVVSSNASQSELGSGMPIQQKLLLCTLLLLTRHKQKFRDLTLGKLHEVYSKVCRVHKIEDLAAEDFHSICLLLENNGLLQVKPHKESRLSKVNLKVDEDELQFIMKDRSLLSSVLEDQAVLKGVI